MRDDHAHVMQVKLCKANTRGVTARVLDQIVMTNDVPVNLTLKLTRRES